MKEARRVAGLRVTPQLIFDVLGLRALFPDADRVRASYDFDSDTIRLKWWSEQFPVHVEGEPLPYIAVEAETTEAGPRLTRWTLP